MLRRVVVLSDVHLATHARTDGPWLGYRRPELAPDGHLAALLDQTACPALELVLAGDVFDLDAAPADGAADARTYAEARSEAGAAALLRQVLADHPVFVAALQRALARGAIVVVLPGNHDAQLALPGVRVELARALGFHPHLVFRSWFHRTGPVLVEHGHAYDPLCVMERAIPQGGRLEDTVGSVSTHYGQAIFALHDPYAPDPFVLSPAAKQALKASGQRAWSEPHMRTGVLAALRDLLLASPEPSQSRALASEIEQSLLIRETGAPPATLAAHRALAAPKGDASLLALAATRSPGYDYGADCDRRQLEAMRAVGALHGARAVVMGHTHTPFATFEGDVFCANSGAWTPSTAPGQPRGAFVDLVVDDARLLDAALRRVLPDGRIV